MVSGGATTDDLLEGTTNLYYTDARARNALSATAPITYNSTTGVIGLATPLATNYGGTGLSSIGSANQLLGVNSGATELEYKNIASLLTAGQGISITGTSTATISNTGVLSLNSLTGALTLQGTTNQINVSSGGSTITLSTPQDIGTLSLPTFSGLTLSSLTPGSVLFAEAGGVISQDNSNLYWDNTNKRLGIGTMSPGAKLQIENGEVWVFNNNQNPRILIGDSGATGQYGFLQWDSSNDYFRIETTGANGLKINDNYVSIGNIYPSQPLIVASGGTEFFRVQSNGNVGIGTTAPGYQLQVGDGTKLSDFALNSSGDSWFYQLAGGVNKSYFGFRNSTDKFTIGTYNSGFVDRLVVDRTTGNVGIGTTTPLSPLHIISGATGGPGNGASPTQGINVGYSNGNGVLNMGVDATGSPFYSWIQSRDKLSATYYNLALNPYGGNVGIGTTAPEAKLDVVGTAKFLTGNHRFYLVEGAGTEDATLAGIRNNNGNPVLNAKNGGILYLNRDVNADVFIESKNGDVEREIATFKANGNVGIGTTTPELPLDVQGDIEIGTGTTGCVRDEDGTVIAGTCSSDARLKKDYALFGKALDKIAGLTVLNYTWADQPEGETQLGLIAQQVESVAPELVVTGEDGLKKIHFEQLPFYTIKALQEVNQKVDAQGLQIDKIGSLLGLTKEDLDKIKSNFIAEVEEKNTLKFAELVASWEAMRVEYQAKLKPEETKVSTESAVQEVQATTTQPTPTPTYSPSTTSSTAETYATYSATMVPLMDQLAGLQGVKFISDQSFSSTQTLDELAQTKTNDNLIPNPLDYIRNLIEQGIKIARKLISETLIAVNGYFKRIFTNELCLVDKETNELVCIDAQTLKNLKELKKETTEPTLTPTPTEITPTPTINAEEPTPTETITPTPTETPTPTVTPTPTEIFPSNEN